MLKGTRTAFLLSVFSLLLIVPAAGQYWFGPKAGAHYIMNDYQSKTHKDSFNVASTPGYHFGIVGTYTASERYSAHIEINYEYYNKRVTNIPEATTETNSYTKYHYLTLPFMLRVNFGKAPFLFYANGGPKLAFWLNSKGSILLDEFNEFSVGTVDYKMVYKQSKSNGDDIRAMVEPNRVQFGFAVGGGAYFDLANSSRIMVDIRYNYAHSNLGFNGSPDFSWVAYSENFEMRFHSISLSVGYVMEFNAQLARKGTSSIKRK